MKNKLYYLATITGIFLGLSLISSVLYSCTINVPGGKLEESTTPTPDSSTVTPTPSIFVAPTPPAPPANKYGPGSGNNMLGASSGTLTIHTNSANGKLTLRAAPAQNSTGLVEIPNGTSGISYFSKIQVGDYVWYAANYGTDTGYLRGDYVNP